MLGFALERESIALTTSLTLDEIGTSVLSSQSQCGITKVIAIDGLAGSGKTSLAAALKNQLQRQEVGMRVEIIAMDDLYNGWDDALTPTLTRTLLNQVLIPISIKQLAIEYRTYDWFTSQQGNVKVLPPADIVILEGVGAGQIQVRKFLSHLIWIDIAPEVGLARVLRRDGDYIESQMRQWQSREYEFFAREKTRDSATIRLDGNAPSYS